MVATDRRLDALSDLEGARCLELDVTDAEGFKRVAQDIAGHEGAIDFLFNNAGVGLAGEVRDMKLADWKPLVDVNLWGVINGIQAVYPAMAERGQGHIVNVASGAGLVPRPGMTAYAASKHAVVGLSHSLRAEAADLGVNVSVVCPGYIGTNIQSSTKYLAMDGKALTDKIPIKPMSAEKCAQIILKGTRKNRGIVMVGVYPRIDWWLYRLAPEFAIWVSRWRARQFRAHRKDPA